MICAITARMSISKVKNGCSVLSVSSGTTNNVFINREFSNNTFFKSVGRKIKFTLTRLKTKFLEFFFLSSKIQLLNAHLYEKQDVKVARKSVGRKVFFFMQFKKIQNSISTCKIYF